MKKTEPHSHKEPQHITKEHAEPVVIHQHEDDTLLAGWFRHALSKGPRYWLTIVGAVAVGCLLITLISGWLHRPAPGSRAWFELMVPSAAMGSSSTGADEGMPRAVQPLVRIAEQHPDTAAARWALLRAGILLYEEGVLDLPARRDVARPRLAQALKFFDQVLESAPKDSPEALEAALCKARALESRGELDEAIVAYQGIAKSFPNTDQAELATKRAATLALPETKKFYEDFYALDFSQVFPPTGDPLPGGVPAPMTQPGTTPSFGTPLLPPLPETKADATKPADAPPTLPADPFAENKAK